MKHYDIPYSCHTLEVQLPGQQVIFDGAMAPSAPAPQWEQGLAQLLDVPTAGPSLASLLKKDQHIVILVEDNTRHTPVKAILPLLVQYLQAHGCALTQLEILVAPGTHRILTEEELVEKVGRFAYDNIKISQHDYRDTASVAQLPPVSIGELEVPVSVNRIALEADLLIGIGNIIPHPNAGYSGGAKILCPGCCGPETVSAMHTACALLGYLPLGRKENGCRDCLEKVAAAAGLSFIINVVLDAENRVVQVVTGDFIKAHRAGTEISKQVFGVPIPQEADILISCSFPYDDDYWQCEKAMISGYFAVKKGGILILMAPCREGLAHNHDELLQWLAMSSAESAEKIRSTFRAHGEGDLVAAAIALGAVTVKEKARIFIVTDGLTDEQVQAMGYRRFATVQQAADEALRLIPGGTVGILPRGGDCLPYVVQ